MTAAADADDAWVERALAERGHAFDFFQAVRLLEQRRPEGLRLLEGRRPGATGVAFRPHAGLAFPPSDVRGAEPLGGGDGVRLVLNFWGFYGVDSRLPSYFGTAAAADDPSADALRDFLDIFAHRLYALLYESWKKFRPALATDRRARARQGRRGRYLAGLVAPAPGAAPNEGPNGTPDASSDGAIDLDDLVPYAGVLRAAARNADGLCRVLRAVVPGVPLAVRQNVARRVAVVPRPRVGRLAGARLGARGERAVLGRTAIAGARVVDESGQFRLVAGPLTWAQFDGLLPGGALARRVAAVVRLYAPDHLAYDVELRLRASELPVTRVGAPTNRLGRTTWIGRARHDVVTETVAYD